MNKNKRKKGCFFEYIAEKFLVKQGSSILYKNYYSRFGEIDIICMQNEAIYFVEVKNISRETLLRQGISGVNHVTENKLAVIAMVSQEFMAQFDIRCDQCFISVIEIIGNNIDFEINYFKTVL